MKPNWILTQGIACAAVVALLLISSQDAMAQRVTGAVFTTDAGCDGVDINIYASKDDVYIDGGPTKMGATGLPPSPTVGTPSYYVQVTEPNGTVLGASVGPAVEVGANGEFVFCYQVSALLVKASDPTIPGYDDTTNPGGEYKLWISQDPTFPPSASKTDNFHISPPNDGGGCPDCPV